MERLLFFRATPKPTLKLPLSVRSAGHYKLGLNAEKERSAAKMFHQLFWTLEGSGDFLLAKRKWTCGPGDVFLYRPGERHQLSPGSEFWRYRWLTLDGPFTGSVIGAFGPLRRSWHAGPCPEAVFEALHAAIRNITPSGELEASNLAYRILGAACSGVAQHRVGNAIAEECRGILEARFRDPRLTVDAVAEELRVHRTTLFRHFRECFRVAPSDYLRNLRLQQAIMTLGCDHSPIGEIAREFGFKDPNYFARAVRRMTGRSPRELRRSS